MLVAPTNRPPNLRDLWPGRPSIGWSDSLPRDSSKAHAVSATRENSLITSELRSIALPSPNPLQPCSEKLSVSPPRNPSPHRRRYSNFASQTTVSTSPSAEISPDQTRIAARPKTICPVTTAIPHHTIPKITNNTAGGPAGLATSARPRFPSTVQAKLVVIPQDGQGIPRNSLITHGGKPN